MEEKIIKLIKKYRETIYTLKENRDRKTGRILAQPV